MAVPSCRTQSRSTTGSSSRDGPRAVVEDSVDGGHDVVPGVGRDRAAGVGVRVEAREVAAADVEPDAVAGQEPVRGRADEHPDLLHPAGFQRLGLRERVPVPEPEDPVGQDLGAAVGVDVDELGGDVRVERAAADVEDGLHGADHVDRPCERIGRVDEHVLPPLERALVERPAAPADGAAAVEGRPADRGHRRARVVQERIRRLVAGGLAGEPAVAADRVRPTIAAEMPLLHLDIGRRPVRLGHPAVGAHEEEANRPVAVGKGVAALQPAVVELEVERGRVLDPEVRQHPEVAFREDPARDRVRPRPDHEVLALPARVAQPAEVAQRSFDKDVVPAAEVQRRDVRLRRVLLGRDRVPERIAVGVGEPFVVPGREPIEQVDAPERPAPVEPVDVVHARADGGDLVVEVLAGGLAREQTGERERAQAPVEREPELEGAALVDPALVIVGRGHVRRDRFECRNAVGPRHRGQPLGRADVGAAHHPHRPVRPGLGSAPGDRVHAVLLLRQERPPLALGVEPAPAVLHDHDVSGFREREAVDGIAGRHPVAVVRRPLDQDRQGFGRIRTVDLGRERHAVAHRHPHVSVDQQPEWGTNPGRRRHSGTVATRTSRGGGAVRRQIA